MPRPVFHSELGKFLAGLREAKGWTQSQAEDIAERRKLTVISHQVIWRLERGKIKNPKREVLEAVATLYGVPYADLARRFIAQQYGITVPGNGRRGEKKVTSAGENRDDSVTLGESPDVTSANSITQPPVEALGRGGSHVDLVTGKTGGPSKARHRPSLAQLAATVTATISELDKLSARRTQLAFVAAELIRRESESSQGRSPRLAGGGGGSAPRRGKS